MAERLEPDAEQFLGDLLAGDLDPQQPAVRDRLDADPELRARYERLQDLAGELDQHAADDRQLLELALGTPTAFDTMAHDLVRQRAQPPRALRWTALLAVAAAAVVGLLLFARGPGGAGDDSVLGSTPTSAPGLSPQGPVDAYDAFTWPLTPPPGGKFRLVFHDGGPNGPVVLEVSGVAASPWRPDAAQRSKLTRAMAWEVVVLNAAGRTVGGAGPVATSLR